MKIKKREKIIKSLILKQVFDENYETQTITIFFLTQACAAILWMKIENRYYTLEIPFSYFSNYLFWMEDKNTFSILELHGRIFQYKAHMFWDSEFA